LNVSNVVTIDRYLIIIIVVCTVCTALLFSYSAIFIAASVRNKLIQVPFDLL